MTDINLNTHERWKECEDKSASRMEAIMRNGNDGLHYEEQRGETDQGVDALAGVLHERGARYGDFKDHARISQSLKLIAHEAPGWANLSDSQAEALDMILNKVARILNGDPDYADSWVDIAGYARLVYERLHGGHA